MNRRRFRTWSSAGFALGAAFVSALGCQSGSGSPDPAGQGEGAPFGSFGTSSSSAKARPIAGGGLVGVGRGHALASDPDGDVVWRLRLGALGGGRVEGRITLEPGDEPGRIVAGTGGRAHIVARRGGAVVSVDTRSGAVLERREVCPAPRGIAFDAQRRELHVACLHGELVTLPEGGGAATRSLRLDPDLRDVVVDGSRLLVSTFRSAEILVLDTGGELLQRTRPFAGGGRVASVMWRMAPRPGGGAIVVYQAALPDAPAVATTPDAYGGVSSPPVVSTEVGLVPPGDGPITSFEHPVGPLDGLALPVDVVALPDGGFAIAAAGGGRVSVFGSQAASEACAAPEGCEPVGVAWVEGRGLVTHYRTPATVAGVRLPSRAVADVGHAVFHRAPRGSVACASCHPEGRDDGLVWQFEEGARRTQYVAGGVGDTLPFHWAGDMRSTSELMSLVFVERMGGASLGATETAALERWMHGIDRLPSPAIREHESPIVALGQALYESDALGCTSCHAGPQHTHARSFDVGTGERLQPARLVDLAARAPYMHDGCAATLRDRFDPACGGASHGEVTQLSAEELDALVAYLETL